MGLVSQVGPSNKNNGFETQQRLFSGGGIGAGGTKHAGHGDWVVVMNPSMPSGFEPTKSLPKPSQWAIPSVVYKPLKEVTIQNKPRKQSSINYLKQIAQTLQQQTQLSQLQAGYTIGGPPLAPPPPSKIDSVKKEPMMGRNEDLENSNKMGNQPGYANTDQTPVVDEKIKIDQEMPEENGTFWDFFNNRLQNRFTNDDQFPSVLPGEFKNSYRDIVHHTNEVKHEPKQETRIKNDNDRQEREVLYRDIVDNERKGLENVYMKLVKSEQLAQQQFDNKQQEKQPEHELSRTFDLVAVEDIDFPMKSPSIESFNLDTGPRPPWEIPAKRKNSDENDSKSKISKTKGESIKTTKRKNSFQTGAEGKIRKAQININTNVPKLKKQPKGEKLDLDNMFPDRVIKGAKNVRPKEIFGGRNVKQKISNEKTAVTKKMNERRKQPALSINTNVPKLKKQPKGEKLDLDNMFPDRVIKGAKNVRPRKKK